MLPGNQGYRKENCSLDRKSRVVMGMPGKQWRKENDPFLFYSVNSSTNIFRAHIYLQNLFCFPYFHGFCILTSSIQPLPSFLQSHHFTFCLTHFSSPMNVFSHFSPNIRYPSTSCIQVQLPIIFSEFLFTYIYRKYEV